MTPTNFLAPIKERLKKATPGPWVHTRHSNSLIGILPHTVVGKDDLAQVCQPSGREEQKANADLIAHAPTDLSRLIEVVEAQAEVITRFKESEMATSGWDDSLLEHAIQKLTTLLGG